jgi:hypothetical protein
MGNVLRKPQESPLEISIELVVNIGTQIFFVRPALSRRKPKETVEM